MVAPFNVDITHGPLQVAGTVSSSTGAPCSFAACLPAQADIDSGTTRQINMQKTVFRFIRIAPPIAFGKKVA